MYRQLLSVLALTATAQGVAHNIAVGRGGSLKFDPSEITAAVGDTLIFHFYDTSGPHNVVSGDFDSPCTPRAGAFYSGTQRGDDDGETAFVVEVTSTDPFYFYCSINRHCQSGMVGAVNAAAGQGAQAYLTAARRASVAEAPSAVGGGTTTSIDKDDDNMTSSTTGTSSGASAATTLSGTRSTTSTTMTGTTTAAASTANNAGSAASSVSNQATSAQPSASTTPNVAGRLSQGVVLGALAAVLGAFVALMA